MIKPFFLFLCATFFCLGLKSQQTLDESSQDWPISIQLMTQSTAITPNFDFLDYPVHPSIFLGTEKVLSSKSLHTWFLGGELGYFYQPAFQHGFLVNAMVGYRLQFNFGLELQAGLGLGYGHMFHPDRIFKYADGQFQEVSNRGVPVGNTFIDLGIGYPLGKKPTSGVLSLRLRYNVEIPLSILGVHQFWGVGYRFYPFQ